MAAALAVLAVPGAGPSFAGTVFRCSMQKFRYKRFIDDARFHAG